jgi:hypothetical protein
MLGLEPFLQRLFDAPANLFVATLYWFDPDSGQAIARQAADHRPSSTQNPPEAVA